MNTTITRIKNSVYVTSGDRAVRIETDGVPASPYYLDYIGHAANVLPCGDIAANVTEFGFSPGVLAAENSGYDIAFPTLDEAILGAKNVLLWLKEAQETFCNAFFNYRRMDKSEYDYREQVKEDFANLLDTVSSPVIAAPEITTIREPQEFDDLLYL